MCEKICENLFILTKKPAPAGFSGWL